METSGSNPDSFTKRMFGIYESGSKAYLANFNYTGNAMSTVTTFMSSVNTGLVGFAPDGGPVPNESTRRTCVGVRDSDASGEADRVYILTTVSGYTAAGATSILRDEFLTSANVQLDGGGSTQLYGANGVFRLDSTPCIINACRGVPNVFAVYAAP